MRQRAEDTNELVTKGYQRQEFALFRFEMNDRFAQQDEKAREYRDQILNGLDKLMGELGQIREDQLFTHRDLKDYERRITRLEQARKVIV